MKAIGLRKKTRLSLVWCLSLIFFLIIAFFAMRSSAILAWNFIYFAAGLASFGLLCLFCIGFKKIIPGSIIESSFLKSLCNIITNQILLIIITIIVIYFLVHQTNMGFRLKPLEISRFFEVLKDNPWSLGFFPWLVYAVLGFGLAYFSCNYDRAGSLNIAMFRNTNRQPQMYFSNLFQVLLGSITQTLVTVIVSIGLIWFCESINLALGFHSLFEYPLHTFMMFSLGALIFRVQNLRLVNFMTRNKMSLGLILITYISCFSSYIILMQAVIHFFDLSKDIFGPQTQGFSHLARAFVPNLETENVRLSLLFWGWWALFIPVQCSIIARHSIGKNIFQVLLLTLTFPGLLFLWLLPNIPNDFFDSFFNSQSISLHWVFALFILFAIMLLWGKTYNIADLLLYAMPHHPELKRRPFKKWLRTTFICINSFLLGLMLIGWLQVQILLTLAAFIMLIITSFFIFSLFLDLIRSLDAKRHRVPEVL